MMHFSHSKYLIFSIILLLNQIDLSANNFWKPLNSSVLDVHDNFRLNSENYFVYDVNSTQLAAFLKTIPCDNQSFQTIDLPTPEGGSMRFYIQNTPILSKQLSQKYPEILTFTAYAVDNRQISAKLDFSPPGFHAMVFESGKNWLIEPYDQHYISFYKNDLQSTQESMYCEFDNSNEELSIPGNSIDIKTQNGTANRSSGNVKKTFRLALSCTGEYAEAVGGSTPTKSSVLSAMTKVINRVNGIYEREIDVTLVFIDDMDTLIYLNPATDPFTANNNGGALLGQNQNNTNSIIGTANYDIGHIFSTGGGGIASLGGVCFNNFKARGVTGLSNPVGDAFAVDYVAHEMGHQFGGDHVFNNCNGNENWRTALEPGSGSTILSYAGICGSQNNLQAHSDDYFHSISLTQISDFLTSAANCSVNESLNIDIPSLKPIGRVYEIPAATAFELIYDDTANHADSFLYIWEQWDRGNLQSPETNGSNFGSGPTFRSYPPKADAKTRIFPRNIFLLNNRYSERGERTPFVDRQLNFKLIARNFYNGWGSSSISDDSVKIKVTKTDTGFVVLYPTTGNLSFNSDNSLQVKWEVAGTNSSPINCDSVGIYLSTDGGDSYPYVLAEKVVNNGVATVTLPSINTAKARIKIKGYNNIFFDISDTVFTINKSNGIAAVGQLEGILVYPNPATEHIFITNHNAETIDIILSNQLGQVLWKGCGKQKEKIATRAFAPGIYFLKINGKQSGKSYIQKVVLK